ncbi:MAG: hypothetical protein HQL29_00105 [Candidatus Omnitrophica bacterium]|nr:hypothetical protein [Candidatus Omnitrophota bacterium]
MNKKLNLPIIKTKTSPKKLNMDEYINFVLLHIKYLQNKENSKLRRSTNNVNVRFSL